MKKKNNLFAILFALLVLIAPVVKAEEVENEELLVAAVEEELVTLEETKASVASIEGTEYETLDDAIKVALATKAPATIVLLGNGEITFSGELSSDITIVGNGYTIKVNKIFNSEGGAIADGRLLLNQGGSLTIKNTNMIFESDSAVQYKALAVSNGNTFSITEGSKVTFNKVYADIENNGNIIVDNSVLEFNDPAYTAIMGSYLSSSLTVRNNSTLRINNTTADAATKNAQRGIVSTTLVVDNSTLTITGTSYGINNCVVSFQNNTTANISGNYIGIRWYAGNSVTVDSSKLVLNDNTNNALASSSATAGGKLTVLASGTLEVTNNGAKNTSDVSTIYSGTGSEIVFEDGANVTITNNSTRALYNGGTATIGNTTVITNNGSEVVAMGGAIYNVGTLTINDNASIANNTAVEVADDIYSEGTLTLGEVGKDLTLDECEHTINGWYDDSTDNRWNADDEETPIHVEKVEAGTYKEVLSIKAAHNRIIKVTVNYVDREGKELAESTEEYYYEDEEYTSEELEFDGYVLVEVEGEANGTVGSEDITITYIYEFVMGEGGEEEIPGLVQTGSEFDYSLMSSAAITLTLIGLVAYTKKRRD